MAKVTGLRTWRNGEIINARDYVYERNLISSALNTNDDTLIDHEARITTAEGDITALEGRVTTAETDIDNLQEQEHLKLKYYAKAQENINKGDVVQFYEIQGDHYLVRRARQEDVNANPKLVMGIAETNVTTGNFFYIIDFGFLEGLDTKGQPLGSFVWFDSEGSTPGAWTITEPTGNKARVLLAAIVRAETSGPANNGKFLIRVTIEPSIQDIQGFLITNSQEGDVLRYDASTQTYQNSADLTTAEADINSLEGRMTTEEANVDNLQGRMTTAETDIDNVEQDLNSHENRQDNPHNVTKIQVGLGNADNTSDFNKPISTATQAALDLKADIIDGKVPQSQLPSYVDDVLEVYVRAGSTEGSSTWLSLTSGGAALTPEAGKIYVIISAGDFEGKTYRWSGSAYSPVGDIALGTTAATAFPGDRGLALETLTNNIVDGDQALALKDQIIRNSATNVVPLIVNTVASTTANLQEWKINSTTKAIVADGIFRSQFGISNLTSENNSVIYTLANGTTIQNNLNNTNPTLTVNKNQGTGNILQIQSAGANKLEVDVNGWLYQNGTRLFTQTGGNENTFFGIASGGTTTSGNFNTSVGRNSLNALTTGTSNTAIGRESLSVLTTGSNNSSLGINAGRTITTGDTNTFIGSGSGFNASQLATASNSTALGNGSFTDKSNQMVFGNASVTEILLGRGSANVGIGTTNPLAKLVVSTNNENFEFGTASVTYNGGIIEYINRTSFSTRPDMNFFNSQGAIKFFTGGANERLRIANNGNVGIGTTSPSQTLEIQSLNQAITNNGNALINTSDTLGVDVGGMLGLGGRFAPSSFTSFGTISGRKDTATAGESAGYLAFATRGASALAERMRITSAGNVGIGTSSPQTRLNVVTTSNTDSVQIRRNSTTAGDIAMLGLRIGDTENNLNFVELQGARTANGADFRIFTRFNSFADMTEKMRVTDVGLVGINETSPTAQLQVKSGATTRVPLIVDTLASHTADLQYWRVNGSTLTWITNAGYFVSPRIQSSSGGNNSVIELNPTGTTISRNIADTNPALIVNLANASATGNIQVWQKAGTAQAFVSNNGSISSSNSFYNGGNGEANGRLTFYSSGPEINRNINDANVVLKVKQANVSASGRLQEWIYGSDVVSSVEKDGIANFTGTPSNAQTVDYTLVLADKGKVVRINSSSNLTVTIPLNSSVLFPIDTEIAILRYGTGTVSISPTSGVTLNSKNSERKISGQYGSVALKKIGTDEWVLVGSLEA
jgi:hypothetical protein